MRTQLYIDGELRTVDIEDGRITTVNEEPTQPKTGWGRVNVGEPYFTLTQYKPHEQGEDNDANDQKMYDSANYFSDGKIAADVFRAQTIWRKLLRWQAENDNPVTWGNDSIASERFSIYCDRFTEQLTVAAPCYSQDAFNVYFSTEKVAYRALEIFYDDLLWLFTEFKYRLDGGAE